MSLACGWEEWGKGWQAKSKVGSSFSHHHLGHALGHALALAFHTPSPLLLAPPPLPPTCRHAHESDMRANILHILWLPIILDVVSQGWAWVLGTSLGQGIAITIMHGAPTTPLPCLGCGTPLALLWWPKALHTHLGQGQPPMYPCPKPATKAPLPHGQPSSPLPNPHPSLCRSSLLPTNSTPPSTTPPPPTWRGLKAWRHG